ncbi:MAG: DUF389 domain-containing protein [Pyrinomonadaceae bacterium]
MKEGPPENSARLKSGLSDLRSLFATLLGVHSEKKESLYIDLSRGATLKDLVYWLQILFSAGIATLGLVMNSPAVIIGAMLISPLMGPILAAGLSLASGDVILGIRSVAKIALSCLLAIIFTVLLVLILPFREMTSEIAARTQPNTLDLVIALFSGAVGSIAVCRDVKGVATSIPGVAIAVALMPPLCVAGYGFGLMLTFDTATGWRICSGGGLLFLTNLVAITFTAMLVFLAVKLSTRQVKERAEEWEHDDPESAYIIGFIDRFPRLAHAREIRSLPVRFVMIVVPLVAILIPLSQSFFQLQSEIAQQRQDNRVRKEILALWQDRFQKTQDGTSRSTIDNLAISEKDGKLNVDLRLFDDVPYNAAEKKEFVALVAMRLSRPVESINLRLTEIPTTSVLAAMRERDKERTPTITELQAMLIQQVDGALSQVEFPSNARLLNRELIMSDGSSWRINVVYLCDSTLEPTVQEEVVGKIRTNLRNNEAAINLERIPTEVGLVEFPRGSSSIPILGLLQLDFAGRVMRENQSLVLLIAVRPRAGEKEGIAGERFQSVVDYLETRWQISPARLKSSQTDLAEGRTWLSFQAGESRPNENKNVQQPPENLEK